MTVQAEAVKRIPIVGGSSDINMEALLKVKPEVVLAWIYYPDQLKFMEQNGLKVIGLYLDSVPEVYGVVELMGKLFERQKEARNTMERMEAVFDLVRKRAASIPPRSRRRALFLYSSPNQVGGPADLTGKMITMAGAHNVADSQTQRTPVVSMETILGWNPDVIIVWGSARYTTASILQNQQYRFVTAVRDGRVYKGPRWSTWSPRLALETLWMAMKIYPELYRDVDLRAVTGRFYRDVYGVPFTPVGAINDYC
jgi:iron complex transport system substrate-binding protein